MLNFMRKVFILVYAHWTRWSFVYLASVKNIYFCFHQVIWKCFLNFFNCCFKNRIFSIPEQVFELIVSNEKNTLNLQLFYHHIFTQMRSFWKVTQTLKNSFSEFKKSFPLFAASFTDACISTYWNCDGFFRYWKSDNRRWVADETWSCTYVNWVDNFIMG